MEHDPIDLLEETESLPEQEQKDISVIENLSSPEEIKAMREILEESLPKSVSEQVADNFKQENLKKDTNVTVSDKTGDAPNNPPTKDGQGEKEKPKVIIDDTVISTFPTDDQRILNNFKGKPLEEVLKSFINAQRLIGKRKEELLKNPEIFPEQPMIQHRQEQEQRTIPTTKTEFDELKKDIIHKELKAKYPDMPTDPLELKNWRANLNYEDPDAYLELKDYEKEVKSRIETDLNKIVHIQQNYREINKNILNDELNQIKEYTDKLNLNLKELGLDLSLDENGQNELLNKLLVDSSNNLDPNLTQKFGNINLIKPTTISYKFFQTYLPQILNHVATKNRNEGFIAANEKKPLRTLAGGLNQGSQVKEITSIDEIENLNDLGKVREELAKMKTKF